MTTNTNGPAELRRLAEQARGWPNTNIADYLDILAAAWEADRAALEVETLTRQKYGNQLYATESANERLIAAASGRGMVSEMDGLAEITVLVIGLHERAERAEAALAQAQEEIVGAHARLDEYNVRRTSDDAAGITHSLQYRIFEMHKAIEQAQTIIALYEGRHPAGLGPDGKEIAPRHRYTGDGICIRCGADAETDTGCVEELQAKLKHASETFEHLREHGQRTDDEELILDAGDEIALSIVLDAYGKPAPAGGETRK